MQGVNASCLVQVPLRLVALSTRVVIPECFPPGVRGCFFPFPRLVSKPLVLVVATSLLPFAPWGDHALFIVVLAIAVRGVLP